VTSTPWKEAAFEGGSFQWGPVNLRLSTDSLKVISRHGTIEMHDSAVFGVSRGVKCWINSESEVLIVAARQSEALYVATMSTHQVEEPDLLIRGDEPQLRHLSGHPAGDGSLLLLYERGLVCISPEGDVRWHRLHDDISARLISAADGVAVIEKQWPVPDSGSLTRYRLEDGAELPDDPTR
jgi:hypothetical protein